ncbi:hypothetical protein M426DRAFT_68639 [Hypoxylon sp. CI-4A]|nr:hypothetical protein M426DRAFT_68639 [Hypoxylon sp. CI-4A]
MAIDVDTSSLLRGGHFKDVGLDTLSLTFQEIQVDIIDIRDGGQPLDLRESIQSGLHEQNADGFRSFPSLLLWDEQGLKYFEQVTYAPEYYLTNKEISLLEEHSIDIARSIKPGTILLELGSGCLRKTGILLQAIENLGTQVDYHALDLDLKELVRTLQELRPSRFKHVGCHGLLGTYDDGTAWLTRKANAEMPKCVLSLRSTMGSFTRTEAAEFWKQWASVLRQGGSSTREPPDAKIIIGLDGCKDEEKVRAAYNDKDGVNKAFILNVLENANSHLGYRCFDQNDWKLKGEWDASGGRHVQYLVPQKDIRFENSVLRRGEEIFVVHSHKYDEKDKIEIWAGSQLREIQRYMNDDKSYGTFIVETN